MPSIATATFTLWALLSAVPAAMAAPSASLAKRTTFNDGYGDIDSASFSMVMVADNTNQGSSYSFTISTAAGQNSPNFHGDSSDWQTLSSPNLPSTVDVTTGKNWGTYSGNADGLTINYANQHFNVEADKRCSHWSHSGADDAKDYYRCLSPINP